jgi:UDP-4-amino-4,6-dideoxy-N-acetyl-beta-L-altrosamine N-acetyltransferase
MIRMIALKKDHMELLLKWRKQARVKDAMLTEVNHSLEKQFEWYNSIRNDPSKKYWLITFEEKPIGVINLSEIDQVNNKCSAGFLIGEESFSSLGAIVLPALYNYIFKKRGFLKVYGSVVSSNKTILKIHEIHGYRQIGYYEKHILKNNEYIDIILVELMAENWLSKKKFASYEAEWD